jgi:hypothetical protein
MPDPRKIVLHSQVGYRPELDSLVAGWIQEGISYVGVIGVDASCVEDVVDQLCIGGGYSPHFMLTASHGPDETLADAVFLAGQLSEGVGSGPVEVVEF